MTAGLLTLNAGQSSVKAALFQVVDGQPERLGRCALVDLGSNPRLTIDGREVAAGSRRPSGHEDAAPMILRWASDVLDGAPLGAIGHRVTHGGLEFTRPVRATAGVLRALERYVPLVPLHQPHNLAMIRAAAAVAPSVPQACCFDTSFHAAMPDVARRFALPRRLIERGVVRYGFHGLSYEHVVTTLPGLTGGALPSRLVVAHLGAGASMCAIRAGVSVACTLGMTGMDGLPMGTRVGTIDPGAILYLLTAGGLTIDELADTLWRQSGLLGVSGGISARVQDLLASKERAAGEAIELFVYRCGRELGSLAAALGGLDALVFTGGIGENSPAIRAAIAGRAGWLGLELDDERNAAGGPRISSDASTIEAWVVPADEEAVIARGALSVCAERFGRPVPLARHFGPNVPARGRGSGAACRR